MKDLPAHSNRRILVVDDNTAIHDDFRKILQPASEVVDEFEASVFGKDEPVTEEATFTLDFAAQGHQALEMVEEAIAKKRPYAMAFMDVRMPPGWDGVETTSQIWKIDPNLQVVICTAYSDYSWDEMIAKLGHSDRLVILKKPFDNVEAMQLAYTLTEKWRLLRQAQEHVDELERMVVARTEELRKSEQRYRSVLENIQEVVFQTDSQGNLTLLNQAWEEITGFTVAETLGTFFLDHVHPDDRHRNRELFRQLIEREKEYCHHEIRYLRRDGGIRWISIHARLTLNSIGQSTGVAGVLTDITERKDAEQARQMMEVQLRQSQKLEAIGNLAAGIAHEINTPTQYVGDNTRFFQSSFQSIKQVLESHERLIRAAKDQTLTPELFARAEEISRANDMDYILEQIPCAIAETLEGVERVTKIVRAMKEFSHPGNREKTPADLNKAIETTVTVARNEWKYVADMNMDLDRDLPLVPCFLGEFNQVILNLVVNAAHAIGDVVATHSVTKGVIVIQTRRDGDFAEIRVSDNGPGIPEADRPRIFEPFFTTKQVGKGTGQGLAIVYGSVVKKHGGTVKFETETGKGTTFIVRLPVSPAGNPTESIPEGSPAASAVAV